MNKMLAENVWTASGAITDFIDLDGIHISSKSSTEGEAINLNH